jgi:hypothetical protein
MYFKNGVRHRQPNGMHFSSLKHALRPVVEAKQSPLFHG